MIKTWRNGAKGSEVKSVIDYNFNVVSRFLSKDIKALSTQERNLLPSDYLSENTLVFDTDEKQWYSYSNGFWIETSVDNGIYTQSISMYDWLNNNIKIPFEQHGIKNPSVQLLIRNDRSFIPVIGGVEIDYEYNITLSTDLPFNGKVVIK